MSPTVAARQSGVKNGKALLRRPDIREYLLNLQAKARQRFEIDRDEVLKGFKAAAEMAEALEDPTGMTGAWREIGKMLGYYEPETKRLILSTEQEHRKQQLETLRESELLDLAGTDVIDAEFTLVDSSRSLDS
jgi:hypothetical protein